MLFSPSLVFSASDNPWQKMLLCADEVTIKHKLNPKSHAHKQTHCQHTRNCQIQFDSEASSLKCWCACRGNAPDAVWRDSEVTLTNGQLTPWLFQLFILGGFNKLFDIPQSLVSMSLQVQWVSFTDWKGYLSVGSADSLNIWCDVHIQTQGSDIFFRWQINSKTDW